LLYKIHVLFLAWWQYSWC